MNRTRGLFVPRKQKSQPHGLASLQGKPWWPGAESKDLRNAPEIKGFTKSPKKLLHKLLQQLCDSHHPYAPGPKASHIAILALR
jgi:hypothetical protein